jgi:FixJ family two-component response regulator
LKSELENVRKRVLVVDDEVDVNSSLRIILQTSGFEVDTYQDPILALKNFKAEAKRSTFTICIILRPYSSFVSFNYSFGDKQTQTRSLK